VTAERRAKSAPCAHHYPQPLRAGDTGTWTAAGIHAVILLPEHLTETDVLTTAYKRKIALTGLAPFWHAASQACSRPQDPPSKLDIMVTDHRGEIGDNIAIWR
jgi:hypothetical protein